MLLCICTPLLYVAVLVTLQIHIHHLNTSLQHQQQDDSTPLHPAQTWLDSEQLVSTFLAGPVLTSGFYIHSLVSKRIKYLWIFRWDTLFLFCRETSSSLDFIRFNSSKLCRFKPEQFSIKVETCGFYSGQQWRDVTTTHCPKPDLTVRKLLLALRT